MPKAHPQRMTQGSARSRTPSDLPAGPIPADGVDALRRYAPKVASQVDKQDQEFTKRFKSAKLHERIPLIDAHYTQERFRAQASQLFALDPTWSRGHYKPWIKSLADRDRQRLIELLDLPPNMAQMFNQFANDFYAGKATEYPQKLKEGNAIGRVLENAGRAAREMLIEADTHWRHRMTPPKVTARQFDALSNLKGRFQSSANTDASHAYWDMEDDQWELSAIHNPEKFKNDSAHAVRVLGLDEKADRPELWMVWLDLLRQETVRYEIYYVKATHDTSSPMGEAGVIDRVVHASAEYLQILTDLAEAAALKRPDKPSKLASPEPLNDDELRRRRSITQLEAAATLGYKSDRQIRNLLARQRLTRTTGGRVVVDEEFHKLKRKRHARTVG